MSPSSSITRSWNKESGSLAIKVKKETRSELFIARFVDGFAVGWRLAVPEAFKDALDIKMTPRVVTVTKEVGDKKTKKSITYNVWTQGQAFNFRAGDVLYDSPKAYAKFRSLWDVAKMMVQVVEASPSGYIDPVRMTIEGSGMMVTQFKPSKKQKPREASEIAILETPIDEGFVKFDIKRISPKTGRIETATLNTSQGGFVSFLQTGILRIPNVGYVDLFLDISRVEWRAEDQIGIPKGLFEL